MSTNNSNIPEFSTSNFHKRKHKTTKSKSKSRKKKKYKSSKIIPRIPIFQKKLAEKLEEKEEIEFVLGDFKDFHKIEELKTFKNMTSLTLINESIKDISLLISNLPNPQNLYYLCLNQNEIINIDDIGKLQNLQEFQINFNYIEKLPKSLLYLKKLKTFWACENNISIIENIPINIESLWLANNYIENIPDNFNKLVNLKQLNLAGNFISSLKDLYLISEIKTLKTIYLSDINFGENPICYFFNYRNFMLHIFNYVEVIDQINATFDEKYDVNRYFESSINKYSEKIKNNFKMCLMIFRTMKTFLFFYSSIQMYKIKVLSIRLKYLENEKENNNDNNYAIEDLEYKIKKCLEECDEMKNSYSKLKMFIKDLNDSFIIYNILKLETYKNFELIPLLPNTKSSLFCINLMKSQLNDEFMKSNYYTGITFNEIYQIKNKKTKYIFNALYNDLIDENKQFGVDKKFKKFLFIILPNKILQNKRKLINFLLENGKAEEENFFFCDNFSYLDENEDNYVTQNIKKYNIAIIYKCTYFESNVEVIDARFNYFGCIEEIKNYLVNLKSNSKKDIICLKVKYNVNFYIYNNKGLILPKFLIKYNYIKSENDDFIDCYESNSENLSTFNEKLFNICSKHFFSEENSDNLNNFIKKEDILKYQFSKFYYFNELDNNFFFFVKNSLLNFLKKCFKYRDKEEYFNEIKILNEKIEEINEYKSENNFLNKYDKYIQEQSQDDINFRKQKTINLFNLNITDIAFNEFLSNISNDLTKFKEISIMTKKIKELSLAKNQLKEINLSKIFDLFPNLEKLDLSLNNISSILIENEKNKNSEFPSLKILDLSFNNISNINIISKLKDVSKCDKIFFYGNPILNDKAKKSNEIKNMKKNINIKNLLFSEYINYSFTKEIKDFNDFIYFRTTKKGDYYRNFKNNILFLNNKNLNSIPKLKHIK